jgi:hypothetical protein
VPELPQRAEVVPNGPALDDLAIREFLAPAARQCLVLLNRRRSVASTLALRVTGARE